MDIKLANNLEELEKLFGSRMQDYEEKLKKATAGNEPSHSSIASLSCEFSEFKTFVLQSLSKIKTQFELLSQGFDKHETFMRRKILLVHGLPEKKDEVLRDTVLKLFTDTMKIPNVSADYLVVCHRLGFTQSRTRPVLVRFLKMEHRHTIWDNKTTLKGTGITISEFLTRTRHRVFTAARQHFGIKQCWTVEGRILVLLPDKTRRKIESWSEIQALIQQHPSSTAGAEQTNKIASAASVVSNAAVFRRTRRRI